MSRRSTWWTNERRTTFDEMWMAGIPSPEIQIRLNALPAAAPVPLEALKKEATKRGVKRPRWARVEQNKRNMRGEPYEVPPPVVPSVADLLGADSSRVHTDKGGALPPRRRGAVPRPPAPIVVPAAFNGTSAVSRAIRAGRTFSIGAKYS